MKKKKQQSNKQFRTNLQTWSMEANYFVSSLFYVSQWRSRHQHGMRRLSDEGGTRRKSMKKQKMKKLVLTIQHQFSCLCCEFRALVYRSKLWFHKHSRILIAQNNPKYFIWYAREWEQNATHGFICIKNLWDFHVEININNISPDNVLINNYNSVLCSR